MKTKTRTMTKRQAETNFRYRVAAWESRNGLNGRHAGDATIIPGVWARLVLVWSLDR